MELPRTHKSSVDSISACIRRFYEAKSQFKIYHGSTNSTRDSDLDSNRIVDTSSLKKILHINVEKRTVIVEPNVAMDALVEATIPHGLLPPVVMEFPGITVGGGFVGTAGESSSFKYGMFDRTVMQVELILADGTVVTASESEHSELFAGLPGSFGTLGVLTALELRLVEIRPYVRVQYHAIHSLEESIFKTKMEALRVENDYVDGILFSKSCGVIVTGTFADRPEAPRSQIQRYARAWDPWFYLHAKKIRCSPSSTTNEDPVTEYVPIIDYIFRYDRGVFWMGVYAFRYFFTPFNRLARFLLDSLMKTRVMYHAFHASGLSDQYFIQDLALPASNTGKFLEYVDETIGLYPLWICPLRSDAPSSFGHPRGHKEEEMLINVGLWGPGPSSPAEYFKVNRNIEAKLKELNGLKWLYARTFYTEQEFWGLYDHQKHSTLRMKYHATSLPTLYDKVKGGMRKKSDHMDKGLMPRLRSIVLNTPFLCGVYGAWKAISGGDYLLKRKRE